MGPEITSAIETIKLLSVVFPCSKTPIGSSVKIDEPLEADVARISACMAISNTASIDNSRD
jgi:hypothetical protein